MADVKRLKADYKRELSRFGRKDLIDRLYVVLNKADKLAQDGFTSTAGLMVERELDEVFTKNEKKRLYNWKFKLATVKGLTASDMVIIRDIIEEIDRYGRVDIVDIEKHTVPNLYKVVSEYNLK